MEEKETELSQLESQLNDKDMEISTVKEYFEKKSDENEKLIKELESIKKQLTLQKSQEDLQP